MKQEIKIFWEPKNTSTATVSIKLGVFFPVSIAINKHKKVQCVLVELRAKTDYFYRTSAASINWITRLQHRTSNSICGNPSRRTFDKTCGEHKRILRHSSKRIDHLILSD